MRGEWRLRLVILKGITMDLYGTAFLAARVQSVFEMAIHTLASYLMERCMVMGHSTTVQRIRVHHEVALRTTFSWALKKKAPVERGVEQTITRHPTDTN
jgi:hypothetical protein